MSKYALVRREVEQQLERASAERKRLRNGTPSSVSSSSPVRIARRTRPLALGDVTRFAEEQWTAREAAEREPQRRPSLVVLTPAALLSRQQASLAHDAAYFDRFVAGELTKREQRVLGFPWSSSLVRRTLASSLGTAQAAMDAVECGFGAQLAGGTHHAFYDRGEGFCTFNDIAVAARLLQQRTNVRRVMVVDLDVHEGNGTAAIFAGDSSVFTFNVHCSANIFSVRQGGDYDVEIPPGTGYVLPFFLSFHVSESYDATGYRH